MRLAIVPVLALCLLAIAGSSTAATVPGGPPGDTEVESVPPVSMPELVGIINMNSSGKIFVKPTNQSGTELTLLEPGQIRIYTADEMSLGVDIFGAEVAAMDRILIEDSLFGAKFLVRVWTIEDEINQLEIRRH